MCGLEDFSTEHRFFWEQNFYVFEKYIFFRYLLKDYTYVTLLNIFNEVESFNLQQAFSNIPDEMVYHLVTEKSKAKKG